MFEDGASLSFRLDRQSPYSFKCQRCGVCCNNKRLLLDSRERTRMAGHLGISLEEFDREYVDPESGEIRTKPDGDCPFLGFQGCRVHHARPTVCRLFPLGLLQDETGRELFGIMPVHPDCLGLFGADGTVEDDLKAQGVE